MPKKSDEMSLFPRGRRQWGRKIVDNAYAPDDPSNCRKSRSVWSTAAENRMLNAVLDAVKNDPDWRNLTLGDVFNRIHGITVVDGALDPAYRDRLKPQAAGEGLGKVD